MPSYKYYICGFNGFQQISECVDQTLCTVDKEDDVNCLSELSHDIEGKTDTEDVSLKKSNNLLSNKNHEQTHTTFSYDFQSCESKANCSCNQKQVNSEQTKACVEDKEFSTSSFRCSRSICLPQLTQLQPVFWSWSQIWTKASDFGYNCHGHNSFNIMTNLKNKFGQIPRPVVQVQDHNILAENGNDNIIIYENGSVSMVTNNVDDVTILDATKDKIYGKKDCKLYEGEITQGDTDILNIQYSLLLNIPVTMVSCGFDHTIILSEPGDVFSLGLGSRGQLGHGEVTVDYQRQPRKIQTFEGIKVVSIVTGGWHSCAITDTADVYVWGWNESGQLGLPNNFRTQDEVCSDTTNVYTQSSVHSKFEDNSYACDKYGGDSTRQVNEHCDSQKYENIKESLDCVTDESSNIKESIVTKLNQSIDGVKVQSEPYGLEIPDRYRVKMAACGSRHTCLLMECGTLFTSGWNHYGQLCHGDKISRDVFEMVKYFIQNNYSIKNVQATAWNTLVTTVTNI
ncbi:RCC1 domain-containing protein 1 [Mactra antiquata]